MEESKYLALVQYVTNQTYPKWIKTKGEQSRWKTEAAKFVIEEGLLKHVEKKVDFTVVIQKHQVQAIMYMMHDHPLGAHRGAGTMAQKIRERYYWKTVYQDCKEHVKTCRECQFQGKAKKNNELHPIPVGGPWDRIGIDIVGPLPVTERGNRYIVTCIDYMTKWVEAKPLPDKSARQVAWFLYEEIICRYGCPQIIQSDNGLEFVNEVVKELLKQFQIWHQTVSPYRPQANGMIERFNRTLGEALSKLKEVYDWDKFVKPTLMAYNTSRQNSTKMTPYFLMYGRTARLPLEEEAFSRNTLLDRVITMVHKLPIFRKSARIAIKRAQEKMR